MAGNLGTAYVQIIPSAKGISGGITKSISGEASSAGDHAGSLLGANLVSKVKSIIAAAGIGKFFKDAISEGSELEQNLGGTEAVFGEFASSIQASAQEAYRNMGMSASEYMATANKMGSLFQGSGLTQTRALDLTSMAMQRAADVASVMGISTSSAMEAIAGAAKGNFTMMDNLGVAMNATTLQAYALEKGVNFKWNTASNAEKAELAMQMFMERTAQYEGNFLRESEETISGSLGSVQAAIRNLLGNLTLGQDIGPALSNLVTTATAFVRGNLIPAVLNIIKALPGAAMQLINAVLPDDLKGTLTNLVKKASAFMTQNLPTVINKITAFIRETIPSMVSAGVDLIKSLIGGMSGGISGAVSTIVGLAIDIISAIIDAAPQIASAGATLITLLVNEVSSLITEKLPEMVEKGVAFAQNFIAGLVEGLPEALTFVSGLIEQLVGALLDAAPGLISSGTELIMSLLEGLVSALPDALRIGTDLASNLIQGIASALPDVVDQVLILIDSILEFVIENGPVLIQSGIELVGNLLAGIASALPDVIGAALDLVVGLGSSLIEHAPELITSGIELIMQLLAGFLKALPDILAAAMSLVVSLGSTILEHAPELLVSGIELVVNLIAGMIEALPDLIDTGLELGGGVIDAFKNFDWLGLGESIIDGIITGIKNAAENLYNELKDLAGKALKAAKDALSINSPSRVFRDVIGVGIVEGIAVGVDRNTGIATDAVTRMSRQLEASFQPDLSISANGVGDYSGGPRVQVVQNIYSEAKSASDLMIEARYNAELGVMAAV